MKNYVAPVAEKLEFNYSDAVVASSSQGHMYRLYTNMYYGCREVPTDIWVEDPNNP